MQSAQPSLFTRPDTIFGACEGIGEDFGFNPQILRVALAAMLFWSPAAAFGTYVAIALAVLIARTLYPKPAGAQAPAVVADVTPRRDNDDEAVVLAAAA